jgi:hypothetical protein
MSIIWQAPTISTHVAGTAGFSIPGIANANRHRPTFDDGSSFAIYNSPFSFMSRALSLSRTALCKLLVIFFLLLGSAVAGVDWTQIERDLSAKIAGANGPGAISLDLVNRASFGKGELDSIRRSLITQLSTLGIQVVKPDQAAAVVQVSLSENLQDYVWVAEIRQGTSPATILMSTARRATAPVLPSAHAPAITISRTLLWSQETRILDTAVVEVSGAPGYLLVLDGTGVRVSRFESGRWREEQFLPVNHVKSWPRDLRGRLVLRKDHLFDAYLPGVICSSTGGASLGLSCRDGDDPWPLSPDLSAFFTPNRNYFTGGLSPGIRQENSVAPFYSAVPVPKANYTLWVFASLDGTLQLVDGVSKQSLSGLGFGSDLAVVRSTCGSGLQVLASSNTDNATDAVRAFEIPDREPVPISPLLEFAGPVISMWTENNATNAVAVIRNLDAGRYEAYRLSISCGQ